MSGPTRRMGIKRAGPNRTGEGSQRVRLGFRLTAFAQKKSRRRAVRYAVRYCTPNRFARGLTVDQIFDNLEDSRLTADEAKKRYQAKRALAVRDSREREMHFKEGQLLTEGSTMPVTSTVTHAGIVRVVRYSFDMP
jgi:hypothetical protein